MAETRIVIVCSRCGAFWDPAAERAACTDSSHEHRRFDSHLHRSRVVLPDSTQVTAVSFGGVDPYARDVSPDFGLYLERWRPPWPHDYLDWPDFSVEVDGADQLNAVASLDHSRHPAVGQGRKGTGSSKAGGCSPMMNRDWEDGCLASMRQTTGPSPSWDRVSRTSIHFADSPSQSGTANAASPLIRVAATGTAGSPMTTQDAIVSPAATTTLTIETTRAISEV